MKPGWPIQKQWKNNLQIKTLNNYENQFLNYCRYAWKTSTDRNRDWFDPSLPWSIPNRYKEYPYWSFLVDDNENFIAFSCIQTHFFELDCARVLTRTYYNPQYRRTNMRYEEFVKTPAVYMLEAQYQWAVENLDIKHLFFSLEFPNRRGTMRRLSKKINKLYGHQWEVLEDMYQTCPDPDNSSCWQNCCVLSLEDREFPLPYITVKEWRKRYGRTTR
jgi:hypothetical protein